MAKWVELKDLMQNPSKYGVEDPRELEIAYVPDKQRITLIRDKTGWNEAQIFETETKGHRYYPTMHEGKLYLASDSVTKSELILSGKLGYKNGSKALRIHAECYSNKVLGATGVTWNEETIGILKIIKNIVACYWTAIQWHRAYAFGMQHVNSSNMRGYNLYGCDGGSAYSRTRSYAVRPLVTLPSNIQVDIEHLDGTPLKLRLPKEVTASASQQELQTEPISRSELLAIVRMNVAEMEKTMKSMQTLTEQMRKIEKWIAQMEQ